MEQVSVNNKAKMLVLLHLQQPLVSSRSQRRNDSRAWIRAFHRHHPHLVLLGQWLWSDQISSLAWEEEDNEPEAKLNISADHNKLVVGPPPPISPPESAPFSPTCFPSHSARRRPLQTAAASVVLITIPLLIRQPTRAVSSSPSTTIRHPTITPRKLRIPTTYATHSKVSPSRDTLQVKSRARQPLQDLNNTFTRKDLVYSCTQVVDGVMGVVGLHPPPVRRYPSRQILRMKTPSAWAGWVEAVGAAGAGGGCLIDHRHSLQALPRMVPERMWPCNSSHLEKSVTWFLLDLACLSLKISASSTKFGEQVGNYFLVQMGLM